MWFDNVDMFEAGAAMAKRSEKLATIENNANMIVDSMMDQYGIDEEDAVKVVTFVEQVMWTLIGFANNSGLQLALRHSDGSCTTREEQFDLMFMISLSEFRDRLPTSYIAHENETMETCELIEIGLENMKYVTSETLKNLRRTIVELPTCERLVKYRAIFEVLNDFVKGMNDDPDVKMTIDEELAGGLWRASLHYAQF